VTDEVEFTREQLAAGERLFARPWGFVLGTPTLESLPPASRPEIAFAGRSNVGKSSLINALVRQNGLARTSNTPGRTQELNFFAVENTAAYLVDMPGYGYAKAPKDKVDAWGMLVRDYLRGRVTLKRVMVLIDARHGVKSADEPIMELLDEAAVSYQIVLTKADKIPVPVLEATLAKVTAAVSRHPAAHPTMRVTSSQTGLGIDLLRAEIAALLST
jgi:GTP-binding protein